MTTSGSLIDPESSFHCYIGALSAEVLSEIFAYYLRFFEVVPVSYMGLGPGEKIPEEYAEGCRKAPLRLASVCHQWRNAVYANPLLWTTIPLSCHGYGEPSGHVKRSKVELDHRHRLYWTHLAARIARAKSLPLFVMVFYNQKLQMHREMGEKLFNTMFSLFPRTQSLHVILAKHGQLDDIGVRPPAAGLFPSETLKEIKFDFLDDTSEAGLAPLVNAIISRAPNMIRLQLPIRIPRMDCSALQSLRDLRIGEIGPETFRRLLETAPELTHLQLDSLSLKSPSHSDAEPVTHRRLSNLRICNSVEAETNMLFASATLPALRALDVTLPSWPSQTCVAFFARSRCELESLILRDTKVVDSNMQHLLLQQDRMVQLRFDLPAAPYVRGIARAEKRPEVPSGVLGLLQTTASFPLLTQLGLCVSVQQIDSVDAILRLRSETGVSRLQELFVIVREKAIWRSAPEKIRNAQEKGVRDAALERLSVGLGSDLTLKVTTWMWAEGRN